MVSKITRQGSDDSNDPRDPSSEALASVGPKDFVMNSAQAMLPLQPVLLNAKIARTIRGASSVTVAVSDPDLEVLNSKALYPADNPGEQESFCALDGLVFALAGTSLQPGHKTQLTLESESINRLRVTAGHLTMSLGSVTRAQFLKRLADHVGVDFFCPELDDKQPVAKPAPTAVEDDTTRKRKRRPGISKHAHLTVAGAPADADQISSIRIALAMADKLKAGLLATQALLVAGIGESNFRKSAVDHVYGTHKGVWQSNQIPPDQVATQAYHFLKGGRSFLAGGAMGLAKSQPTLSPGAIALKTEISDASGAAFYDRWIDEANAMISAMTGDTAGVLDGETITGPETVEVPTQFQLKADETLWDCMVRVAGEVSGWYLFEVAGTIYYCSGTYLRASQPRMLVTPGAEGIDEVTFDVMTSPKYDDTITVKCHMRIWQAPPGSTVDVVGYGPVDDRWLVQDIQRDSIANSDTTVTLCRPVPKGKEPAPTTKTIDRKTPDVPSLTVGQPGDDGTASPKYGRATPAGTEVPNTSWNPQRKPINKWIVPILQWAHDAGWSGVVTSGYRTPAEQMAAATQYAATRGGLQIVYPNGPLASNHCKNTYPGGAVDVTGAFQLAYLLKKYPYTPNLMWGGPTIEDDVHFSANGH